MRLIPDACSRQTSSAAERRTFDMLKAVDPDDRSVVCLHSLNLTQHDYKRVAELDFVILSNDFLMVLEVKGGRVACQDGVWTFTDRHDVQHRSSEGPFQQARSGLYALLDRIPDHSSRVKRTAYGYGVVLPDIVFDAASVEWEREMVLDARAFESVDTFRKAIDHLIDYWRRKTHQIERMTDAATNAIAQALRPDFERLPSLGIRADAIDAALEGLTAEQYSYIDHTSDSDRIVCEGGAGTGKTFLAVEIARREANRGSQVAFLTSTNVQRSFVESRLSLPGIAVVTPSELPIDTVDVLVVDEGQDVLNVDDLALMDTSLRGGLERGRWRVFLDANRQSGLVGRFDPLALDFLVTDCHGFRTRLSRNCRNTRNIVIQTKLLTAADLGTPTAGEGPPVAMKYFDSEDEAVSLLDEELAHLRLEGVEPGDITILSPLDYEQSIAARSSPARRRRLHVVDEAVTRLWPHRFTSFSTVPMFKGMESQFVLVVDIGSLENERDINTMYVAMSRARSALWIALPRAMEEVVTDLQLRNSKAVMEDLRSDRY